ncbi:MAG: acyltransferase family protein [Burkholderiales bacterium]
MHENYRRFRKDINALRALGVALVVLFHFKVRGFSGGFAGVDIFFVVSGYLMTSIIVGAQERRRFSYADFLAARMVRIWPALIVLSCVVIAIAVLCLPPVDLRAVAANGFYSLFFWSNQIYANQAGYFAPTSDQNPFLHTWSLSVEWQFYMLFPLLLLAGRRTFGRRGPTIVVAFVVLGSLIWCLLEPSDTLRFFGLPSRAWELGTGGIAYLLGRHFQPAANRRLVRPLLAYCGLLLILASIAFIDANRPWPLPWAVLPVLGTALFIIARHEGNLLARSDTVQKLGLWSYSIYLWHWPVVAALHFLHWNQPWQAAAGMVASLLLGRASFQLVEEPARSWFKSGGRVRLGALATAGSWLLVVGLAIVMVKLQGLPQRKPELAASLSTLADAERDWEFPADCGNWKVSKQFEICRLNEQARGAPWLFVGDSHAEHYYPYFKTHTAHPVDFLTSGGCLPVPNTNSTRPGYHCPEFVEEIRKVAASGRYERIIVAAMWKSYFDGDTCIWQEEACTKVISDPSSRELVLDALKGLLLDFRRGGLAVSLVLPEPLVNYNVPRELARRRFLGVDEAEVVSVAYDRHSAETGAVRAGLLEVANVVDASVADPEQHLCHHGRCWLVDERGMPIVRDANHYRASWVATRAHFLDGLDRDDLRSRQVWD